MSEICDDFWIFQNMKNSFNLSMSWLFGKGKRCLEKTVREPGETSHPIDSDGPPGILALDFACPNSKYCFKIHCAQAAVFKYLVRRVFQAPNIN